MNNLMKKKVSVLDLIRGNSVPLMFVLICAVFIPLSGSPAAICSTRS